MNILNDYESYSGYFSETKFWTKIKNVAKKAGVKVIYLALILYYELIDPNVDIKKKAIIIGASGYLILPTDLIPDTIPIVGFADDLSALTDAYKFVEGNLTLEVERKAKHKISEWFGTIDESELNI